MKRFTALPGRAPLSADSDGLRLLLVALSGAVLFHGGLLPFTHANTYDAFIHMFFADSYHRSWFDPWEPRWYTGFATTSYPPGTHMAMAGLMHIMPLRAAFVVVQLTGLVLLTIGVYRFALLWVPPRSAGYAAIALVLSSAISETIHLFGQLPTIFSLGVFLNGLPYVYRWIVSGRLTDLAAAAIFASATTAAHHVTTLFGGILFIIPLGLQALRAAAEIRAPKTVLAWSTVFLAPLGRGLLLGAIMVGAMVLTVYPYWAWSVSDPITQVPIPHGSRESFLVRTDLGFMFFLLPWGTALFLLPYVAVKTATTRLWPLGLSVLFCFVLGTGGTTPIPRMILHGAFDILTLDRFTFWATILILPFTGFLLDGLLHGRSGEALRAAFGRGLHRLLIGGYFTAAVAIAVFAAILPSIQPTQPKFIDPGPIVRFLEEDEHHRWRYLTLGFGDQFAYLSSLTEAQSVDGNYHSARRLPDLTRFSVERLENAKYLGVPGLGSLKQFLVNADSYHLKFVFSNDDFYDPLLHFSGWTRLNRLANGITVWEKPDVSPLPPFTPRREIPALHMAMWGLLPPLALCLAALVFVTGAIRRNFGVSGPEIRPVEPKRDAFRNPALVRWVVLGAFAVLLLGGGWLGIRIADTARQPLSAEETVAGYFDDLDFRRFEAAYDRLDPGTRPDLESVLFSWRWRGGLIASYGKLSDMRIMEVRQSGNLADWQVELDWLTPLDLRTEVLDVRTIRRDGTWYLAPTSLRPVQNPARLQRDSDVVWSVSGRRQPRAETDLHRDRLDRPRVDLHGARVVERDGRFHTVGAVTNTDVDPAFVSLFSTLTAEGDALTDHAAGTALTQRLLPGETSGFRIGFEGVLSLTDAEARGRFDPTMYIPPEFAAPPDGAVVEARALVTGKDLYRGIGLNGVTVTTDPDIGAPTVAGLAVNTGTLSATVVRVVALLYDETCQPIWTEAGYVETNMYPGQSAPFSIALPRRDELRVVSGIAPETFVVNGSNPQADLTLPGAEDGTLNLDVEGYCALRLTVSTMTHDPLF